MSEESKQNLNSIETYSNNSLESDKSGSLKSVKKDNIEVVLVPNKQLDKTTKLFFRLKAMLNNDNDKFKPQQQKKTYTYDELENFIKQYTKTYTPNKQNKTLDSAYWNIGGDIRFPLNNDNLTKNVTEQLQQLLNLLNKTITEENSDHKKTTNKFVFKGHLTFLHYAIHDDNYEEEEEQTKPQKTFDDILEQIHNNIKASYNISIDRFPIKLKPKPKPIVITKEFTTLFNKAMGKDKETIIESIIKTFNISSKQRENMWKNFEKEGTYNYDTNATQEERQIIITSAYDPNAWKKLKKVFNITNRDEIKYSTNNQKLKKNIDEIPVNETKIQYTPVLQQKGNKIFLSDELLKSMTTTYPYLYFFANMYNILTNKQNTNLLSENKTMKKEIFDTKIVKTNKFIWDDTIANMTICTPPFYRNNNTKTTIDYFDRINKQFKNPKITMQQIQEFVKDQRQLAFDDLLKEIQTLCEQNIDNENIEKIKKYFTQKYTAAISNQEPEQQEQSIKRLYQEFLKLKKIIQLPKYSQNPNKIMFGKTKQIITTKQPIIDELNKYIQDWNPNNKTPMFQPQWGTKEEKPNILHLLDILQNIIDINEAASEKPMQDEKIANKLSAIKKHLSDKKPNLFSLLEIGPKEVFFKPTFKDQDTKANIPEDLLNDYQIKQNSNPYQMAWHHYYDKNYKNLYNNKPPIPEIQAHLSKDNKELSTGVKDLCNPLLLLSQQQCDYVYFKNKDSNMLQILLNALQDITPILKGKDILTNTQDELNDIKKWIENEVEPYYNLYEKIKDNTSEPKVIQHKYFLKKKEQNINVSNNQSFESENGIEYPNKKPINPPKKGEKGKKHNHSTLTNDIGIGDRDDSNNYLKPAGRFGTLTGWTQQSSKRAGADILAAYEKDKLPSYQKDANGSSIRNNLTRNPILHTEKNTNILQSKLNSLSIKQNNNDVNNTFISQQRNQAINQKLLEVIKEIEQSKKQDNMNTKLPPIDYSRNNNIGLEAQLARLGEASRKDQYNSYNKNIGASRAFDNYHYSQQNRQNNTFNNNGYNNYNNYRQINNYSGQQNNNFSNLANNGYNIINNLL